MKPRTIALTPIAGVLALIASTSIAFSDEPGSNRPDQARLPFSLFEILGPDRMTDEFEVPDGMQLVITDLIIQNINPGGPVPDYVFSRLSIGPFENNEVEFGERREEDIQVHVVGNETFKVNFSTGLEAFTFFRLYNAPNSTAVTTTVIVSGYLIGNDHKVSK